MTTLEPVLAKGLTRKVVHKYLGKVLVKFGSFWTHFLGYDCLVPWEQNLFIYLLHNFSYISPI
jgi:hypothetical protein